MWQFKVHKSHLNWHYLAIFILISNVVDASKETDVLQFSPLLTSADVRFATTRCQNEFAHKNETLKVLWQSNIYPNNQQTHCYIKCVLEKLGLIDLKSRGFDLNKLLDIWNVSQTRIADFTCLEKFIPDAELDGRCVSYYYKWLAFHLNCPKLMKITFFENDTTKSASINLMYSKPLGMSASEFCNIATDKIDNFQSKTAASLADNFLVDNKCNLYCILKQFRYFDAYGRLDENEIRLSFEEAKQFTAANEMPIKFCTHHANSFYNGSDEGYCTMAYILSNCLRRSSQNFIEVYRQRNINTQQY